MRKALLYETSLKQVKGLELGAGPEGIDIEPNHLKILKGADHLDHLGLCFASLTTKMITSDFFRRWMNLSRLISRRLLEKIVDLGIKDLSFYPKPENPPIRK